METRVCKTCLETKPVESFHIDARSADGIHRHCKDCRKEHRAKYRTKAQSREQSRIWRLKNPGRHARNNKTYRVAHPGLGTERSRRFVKEFPEKHEAHKLVQSAVKSGKLVRQCCEVCGENPTHAHHDDYSKPLEVRWLCVYHHRQVHVAIREANNVQTM